MATHPLGATASSSTTLLSSSSSSSSTSNQHLQIIPSLPYFFLLASLTLVGAQQQPVGVVRWHRQAGGPISSRPTVAKDNAQVYVGSEDGNVYAFTASGGSVAWRSKTGGAVYASPALHPDDKMMYTGSFDGKLYCMDVTNGNVVSNAGENTILQEMVLVSGSYAKGTRLCCCTPALHTCITHARADACQQVVLTFHRVLFIFIISRC
jgi:hypothetical protein